MSVTPADRPRRLISLELYEDQLAALDERARAAERSRAAEIRRLIDMSLGERGSESEQDGPQAREPVA